MGPGHQLFGEGVGGEGVVRRAEGIDMGGEGTGGGGESRRA